MAMDSKKGTFYYSWEPAAFLADHEFVMMDSAERGLYLTILLFLYQEQGELEISKSRLKKISNWNETDLKWKKSLKNVLSCFTVQTQGRSLIIRKNRVTREIEKAQNARQQRVKAANARWNNKQPDDADACADASISQCENHAKGMEGEGTKRVSERETDRPSNQPQIDPSWLLQTFDRVAPLLKPRDTGDRTVIKGIITHVDCLVKSGRYNGGSWEMLIKMAVESTNKQKPVAYFIAAAKNHFGDYRNVSD